MPFEKVNKGISVTINKDELQGDAKAFLLNAFKAITGVDIDKPYKDKHQSIAEGVFREILPYKQGTLADFITKEAKSNYHFSFRKKLSQIIVQAKSSRHMANPQMREVAEGLSSLNEALELQINELKNKSSAASSGLEDSLNNMGSDPIMANMARLYPITFGNGKGK